ncbi:MAG: hypothetical protein H0U74_02040 [Bradymonadaceae bacterium]|nr:hypothetical protein [Lujinxingiaceae bacterium]
MPQPNFKHLVMSTLAIATALAFVSPNPAQACSYAESYAPFEFAPDDEKAPDVANFPVLELALERISRGKGVDRSGGTTSCDGDGLIDFTISGWQEGYGIHLDFEGTLPDNFLPPTHPIEPLEGRPLYFLWHDGSTDDQEPFSFTLTATPVDQWGRKGQPSAPLLIAHPGSTSDSGGCNVTTAPPASPLSAALIALAMGFALIRRARH